MTMDKRDLWSIPVKHSSTVLDGVVKNCYIDPYNPIIPGHYEPFPATFPSTGTGWFQKQLGIATLQDMLWREETGAHGPVFVLDLPGVVADDLHVELMENRYLVVYSTRIDDKNRTQTRTQLDLNGKDVDVNSAKASFKHCVLRVEFELGTVVPNVKKLDVET